MIDNPKPERKAQLNGAEKLARKAEIQAAAEVAMAEHEERELAKRANMAKLRAERLAREAR